MFNCLLRAGLTTCRQQSANLVKLLTAKNNYSQLHPVGWQADRCVSHWILTGPGPLVSCWFQLDPSAGAADTLQPTRPLAVLLKLLIFDFVLQCTLISLANIIMLTRPYIL